MNTQTQNTEKKSNAEVKGLALNLLYQYAKEYYLYEREHFAKFLGIDIFKVDGSLKQKYEHEKLSFEGRLKDGTHINVHYWFTYKYGSFDIHVKLCINGGSYDTKPPTYFCQYEEITITLFNTEDNKLIKTDKDISYLDERFNVKELEALAKEIQKAAEVYKAMYDKMPYQFTDIFWLDRLTRR